MSTSRQPFFVTGHPRSRTFWFAQYLTAAGSACSSEVLCYHEFLSRCYRREQFYQEMSLPGRGNSDCGLILTDFQSVWPDAPTLVVERSLDAVEASLHHQGVTNVRADLWSAQRKLDRLDGMRVRFEEIDDQIETIHRYLLPEVPFNQSLADGYVRKRLVQTRFPVNPSAARIWQNVCLDG